MMHKFMNALYKEWLILIRDIPALIILFLMPVLLILVVTLAQERALKNQAERTVMCISAPEGSLLAKQLKQDIMESGMFILASDSLSPEELAKSIAEGNIPLGVSIAHGDTALTLLMDPAMHQSYTSVILNAARFLIKGAQGKLLMQKMLSLNPISMGDPETILSRLPDITVEYAVRVKSTIKPTPVQNNIPGFILFAMFFIVIPLSGSIIAEKNEGPFLRMRTLPVPSGLFLGAKVALFWLVCLIQFVLMLFISHFLFFQILGYPPLTFGTSIPALVIATIAAALAAVGFGLLVGVLSSSHAQAALLGSVLVVILGIISGTFLPIHVMPETIQFISHLSPIRWGIDNYLDLFIRDGSIRDILPRSLWLLLFFIFAMLISIPIFAKRN